MSRHARARNAKQGFTLIELLIVISILGAFMGSAAMVFESATRVAQDGQDRLDLTAADRRARTAIRRALQNASLDTLSNLEVVGPSHRPRFRIVEQFVGGAPVLSEEMELVYERRVADLDGAGPVGRIVLRVVGTESGWILAPVVKEGSFRVTLEGRLCVVSFLTMAQIQDGAPITLESKTRIFLENP